MMGFLQPVTNLRDYMSQNPPGVTFFLCLLTLAISFICLSSYSYTHTLPNPDTTTDWNLLLSSLSHLQLCVKENATSSELVPSVPSPMEQGTDRKSSSRPSSVTHLHLQVPLAVTTSSPSGSLKKFSLHTVLSASQLHLEGNANVRLTLDYLSGNSTHTCLTISAPADLLPMNLLPPKCHASGKNISTIHVEATDQLPTASQTCYSLQWKNDPSLTVMLTRKEQNVAVQHLLEASVCLLGVCFILCLAASMTQSLTRRYHWNGLDVQNEPLIES